MNAPNDYQRFFIQDGRHVGAYEEMYRACPDPWNIEALGFRLDMRLALALLEHYRPPCRQALDAGCGAGLFTGFLADRVWRWAPSAMITALDVAPTALEKARAHLPDPRISFQAADLNQGLDFAAGGRFDLAVMAQTLWGVLENLELVLSEFYRVLSPQGWLLISQHFHPPEKQTYGRDIVSGPEDLAAFLARAGFTIEGWAETNPLSNRHVAFMARKA